MKQRLARWLNGAETPTAPLDPAIRDLVSRVEKLELERPAFLVELQNLFAACEDVLGRAESARGRAAALKSRQKQQEEAAPDPNDRPAVLANVRALLRSQGKIVG